MPVSLAGVADEVSDRIRNYDEIVDCLTTDCLYELSVKRDKRYALIWLEVNYATVKNIYVKSFYISELTLH